MFVGRIVVEDDVDSLLHWNRFLDGVEEADELLMAMALHTPADHLTFEHLERRKERGGTVTLVIMGHGSGPALLYRQALVGKVHGLGSAPSIHLRNHPLGGSARRRPPRGSPPPPRPPACAGPHPSA